LFIKFEDYTNRTVQDFTIVPLELNINGNFTLRDLEDGRQNYTGFYEHTNLTIGTCDFAINSKVDEYLKTKVASEDDFDEDEEDKEEGSIRKMKLSNFQQLLCGMGPAISKAIDANHAEVETNIRKYGDTLNAIFNQLSNKTLDQ